MVSAQEASVEISEQGLGRRLVLFPPQQIERVRNLDFHGIPHVRPDVNPDHAWIEVLGAVPNTTVTIVFDVA